MNNCRGQWGDEGKGKIVDVLCESMDIVARCQVDSLGFWV